MDNKSNSIWLLMVGAGHSVSSVKIDCLSTERDVQDFTFSNWSKGECLQGTWGLLPVRTEGLDFFNF